MTQTALKLSANDYPVGVFTSTYTGDEAFLADHIIQGQKILPGMAYLEIARAAVANSVELNDSQMIVLSDSIFVNALLVSEKRAVEVKVYPGANGQFGVEVMTEQGVHFQSKVSIQEKEQQQRVNLKELQVECQTKGPSKQQFYSTFRKRGVNLGLSHQGVEDIRLGHDRALVRVSIANSSDRGMALDPGMLDSIIQGGVALASNPEADVVPFAVKNTKIFGPLDDQMYVHIIKTAQGCDYVAFDDNGEVRVTITDFLTREIDLSSQQDQLVYYKPDWEHQEQLIELENDSENITVIQNKDDYSSLVKSVFATAKKLIKQKSEHHTIEIRLPSDKPSWRGIIALLKSINLEYSKINFRLKFGEDLIQLKYAEVDMRAVDDHSWLDNKTVLITGGLGGLGKIFALDIAEATKGCTLILVGRSELTQGKNDFIKHLESKGAKVIYAQTDITDSAQVQALVKNYPQLNGVIHGSGIVNDNFINKKSVEDIDSVLAPKVKGIEYLDRATANHKLDYFIALSSIAGTLGNAGQADYAAANGFMDAYISNRVEDVSKGRRYGKSISINWSLWNSDGMQMDEATAQNLLQVYKIKPLPVENGLTALKQIIASEYQQLVVLFGNKKAIAPMFNKTASQNKPDVQQKISQIQPAQNNKLTRKIAQEVRVQTAEHLKRQPNQLDDKADWAEFGLDSILLSSFVNKLNTRFNLNLMPTVLFEATNMHLFAEYLAENHHEEMAKELSSGGDEKSSRQVVVEKPKQDIKLEQGNAQEDINAFAQGFKKSYRETVSFREKDVAIVGMSCRIAGSKNPEEFWQMLDEERDMVSEIPKERWDWQDYPGVSKWGSFVDDVDEFDSLFFGISPAEAIYMTPEQRLMMQYVWECIENAGYGGEDVKGNNTGLFIGCGPSGYTSILSHSPIEAYSATGSVSSVGPNRISYFMDWHGPSNPIETACSSALVAVHRSVEAIRAGHCEQAIAGGVNLLLSPEGYISFSKSGMLCEDGRCKTFSDDANGYVRGEGIGMLMLKSLKSAIQDGNVIHALVKGTAENHGGRTNSLTAPNPKSQASVIKRAVEDAEIDFSRIGYIECHGTGTSLGDPVEIKGLKTVASDLLGGNQTSQICKLGSIKSNIGHLEYGAGVVGLIKLILQMKHKKIAKSLHCEKVSRYIDLKGTPFEIAQEASEWSVEPGKTRIGGVSSFGFGGVNAHVILEEYQDDVSAGAQQTAPDNDEQETYILTFSAKNEQQLIDYVAQYQDFLKTFDRKPDSLKRIAYTLQIGRAEMQERLVFVVESMDEWVEKVDNFVQNNGKIFDNKIYRGTVNNNSNNRIELGDTQAGVDYIKQLIDTRESEKIAELWVKGANIDWQILHH